MSLFEAFSNSSMLHAAVVHLPIVFVLLGVPLIYYLAISQQKTEALRWFTVGFYAITAVISYAALVTGHGAMDRIPNDHRVAKEVWDLVGQHEEMGEKVWLFAAGVTLLLALSAIPVRVIRQLFVGIGMLAAIVLAVWVAILGHFGGMLVYQHGVGTPAMGELTAQPAPDEQTAPATAEPAPTDRAPATLDPPADDLVPPARAIDIEAAKAISFTKDVRPILEENCDECHNPEKMRGDFDTTSVLAMAEGGKKGGVGVVPGKPDEGSLVKYIRGAMQPQMPKGEDPLTEDQLHVIRQWIAAGAFDDSSGAAPAAAPTVETAPSGELPEAEAKPEESVPTSAPEAEAPVPETTPEPAAPANEAPETTPADAAPAASTTSAPSIDELLFSGGPEDLLVKRRAYRLGLVPQPPAPPATGAPVNNDVDRFVAAKWQQVDPTFTGAVCDDSAFARRVYLDVIGVIPTADEVKAFVQDTAEDKRAKLIDSLLARNDEYAAHWTPFWEDALCSNGNHQGGVGTRGNYRDWIFNSFKENKAYDVMVAELLDPHMPDHPARFVLRQDHTRILKSAADTAQVFLGTQMKCAACHNHFDNKEWSQRRFLSFAGYFADQDLELIKCEAHTDEYVPTGFVFDLPRMPTDVPTTEDERAARIAQLLIDPCNPRFAKTIVNRLWKRFLGMGLFEPADNFREDTPASHPELLEWLAYDFMAHGYDIKHTMRLILTSRTYQLEYNAALEDHFDVAKPAEPRYFRSPRLRRMTAEQLLDSVKVALGEKLEDGTRVYRSDESTPLTRALGRPATRNEVSTARAEDSAVVQTLELLNGDEYHDRIYDGEFVFAAAQRGREAGAYDGVVDDLYWSVLGRASNDSERAAGSEFVAGAAVDPASPAIVESVVADETLPEGTASTATWATVNGPDAPVFSGGASWKLSAPPAPVQEAPAPAEGADAPISETETVDPANTQTASFDGASAITFAADESGSGVAFAQEQSVAETAPPATPEVVSAEPAEASAPTVVEQSLGALPQAIVVNPDDVLYAYVYIDPTDPPKAIMLQWKSGDSWEHRAYWGDDVLKTDIAEGPARRGMGALPEAGKWVRLEVPAYLVNLGRDRRGIGEVSIVQAGGTAYWDKTGVLSAPLGGPTTAVGDALWALITSPEFQYIR
ncbi:MAG: DUF1553 domain-containing protein [Candidatus Hydrogenedentes bacterium]|nr:DUF1553 domain-containing protein [Candidatus Hydrogenedentota bacterium]